MLVTPDYEIKKAGKERVLDEIFGGLHMSRPILVQHQDVMPTVQLVLLLVCRSCPEQQNCPDNASCGMTPPTEQSDRRTTKTRNSWN